MLENYIYRNLDRYGNCLISNSLYKRLGKTKILKDLKQHGFNCEIKISGSDTKVNRYVYFGTFSESNVILEVIND